MPSPIVKLPAPALLLASLVGVVAAACSHRAPPAYPRPTLGLHRPASSPTPVAAPALLERVRHDDRRETGTLAGAHEQVAYELRRCAPVGEPHPLVLVVPILAGGRDLLSLVADYMLGYGFDVAFCERAGSALTPPQRTDDLDELFRRTVLHQRLLLAWLRSDGTPPPAVHVLGLSMGGMVSTVVAALEPDLDSVAICLSGADLASMVLVSSERRVQAWRAWRRATDGLGDDSLHWELEQFLRHEPYRFAPAVATAKVLFVSADFDSVVPRRNRDLLWEALGRPQRLDLPLGHYSAAIAIDKVLGAAAGHFRAHGTAGG